MANGRPKRKKVDLSEDSLIGLMQEVYNEISDIKTKALQGYKQCVNQLKDDEEETPSGIVNKAANDYLRTAATASDRKIQILKIQAAILVKSGQGKLSGKMMENLEKDDRATIHQLLKDGKIDLEKLNEKYD